MISAQFRPVSQIGMIHFRLDILLQLLMTRMIRTGLLRTQRERSADSRVRMMMPRTRRRSKGKMRITGHHIAGPSIGRSTLRPLRMDLMLLLLLLLVMMLLLLLLLRMQWKVLVRIHHRRGVQMIVRMVMVRRWRRGIERRVKRWRNEMLLRLLLLLLEMDRLRGVGCVAGRAARGRRHGTGVVHQMRVSVTAAGRRCRCRRARSAGLLLRWLLALVIHAVLEFGLHQIEMIKPAVGSHHLGFSLTARRDKDR